VKNSRAEMAERVLSTVAQQALTGYNLNGSSEVEELRVIRKVHPNKATKPTRSSDTDQT
jgi:hypothetical protein